MRITYNGSGIFDIDGDELQPGDITEVSDQRGTELLGRFPGILTSSQPAPTPPVASSTPSAQSSSGTAQSPPIGETD